MKKRMKLIDAIRKKFCKHEYETKQINGFIVADGWLAQPTIKRCKKCGKVLKED